jgi:hypothetical protein
MLEIMIRVLRPINPTERPQELAYPWEGDRRAQGVGEAFEAEEGFEEDEGAGEDFGGGEGVRFEVPGGEGVDEEGAAVGVDLDGPFHRD